MREVTHSPSPNYKKIKKSNLTIEQYCTNEGIDLLAFQFWQKYIDLEDKFTFFQSFVPEYLRRAKKALELLDHYIELDPNLRMPLMRDAIISYAVLFGKSRGRASYKWQLETETFVPHNLQEVHKKLCTIRDVIIAHCDLGPRNPKVTSVGIVLKGKGYYWNDYKALIPQFRELIEAVTKNLKSYIAQENLVSAEAAFQDLNPTPEALKNPGRPKTS